MNFDGSRRVRRLHVCLAVCAVVTAAIAIVGATGPQLALTPTVFTLDGQQAPTLPARWVVVAAAVLLGGAAPLALLPRIRRAARILIGLWWLLMVMAVALVVQSALNVTDRSTDIADMMGLSVMAPPMSMQWGIYLQLAAAVGAICCGLLAWWAGIVESDEADESGDQERGGQWRTWPRSTWVLCGLASTLVVLALSTPLYVGDQRSAPWMGASPGLDSWAQLLLAVGIVVTLLSMRRTDGHIWVRAAAAVVALALYLASGPLTWGPVSDHRFAVGAWIAVAAVVAVAAATLRAHSRR